MLHRTLLVVQVLVLCALAGCVRGYDPHVTERPMPSELHADAHAEAAVDPVDVTVPGAAETNDTRAVALAEVVTVAMGEPTSVLEAAARLEAASGQVATSDGRLLPGVSADFRVRYLDGREVGSFGILQADVSFARYEPTAAFFYRNNPGAAGTGSKAERRFADAAGYDLKEAQRQAMLQAALSYQDIALTRASMAIATQLVQDAQRFYDIANARAVAEVASGADVARAEAALAQAQRTEIQARAFWKAASIRLARLLRWDLTELLTTGDEQVGIEPFVDDASETKLTGEADHARPDVLAAKKRAEGGTIRTKQMWWDLLGPEVDASIGGRLLGTQMAHLGPTLIGYAFIGVSFDFEKGGRVRTAKANAKALQFRAEAISEQADADIETAVVNVQAAREAIPPARAEVDAAERSYAIELARFDAGTGSGFEVIQSQNMKARAKLSFIEQILRFNAAQIELAAAIGHLTPELFAP
jgi:outer membrane protein TolC